MGQAVQLQAQLPHELRAFLQRDVLPIAARGTPGVFVLVRAENAHGGCRTLSTPRRTSSFFRNFRGQRGLRLRHARRVAQMGRGLLRAERPRSPLATTGLPPTRRGPNEG